MKETMIQFFEWYLQDDGNLWDHAKNEAKNLADNGFTMIWLPPAYKGQAGKSDVGYGVYDLYDLGEFDAKGSVETKYGSKDEYIQAVDALKENGIRPLADIVLNHRMGADDVESVRGHTVSSQNREQLTSDEFDMKVWTKFNFPARNGKYSDYQWSASDFTGTDYDANTNRNDILLFKDKKWNENVSKEQGNFDYIMGADVDFTIPDVVAELYRWGIWYTTLTGIQGFRLDAIKSIDARFFRGWLKKMKEYGDHPDFAVGEFWTSHTEELIQYLKDSGHCMSLFDVPLHYRFQEISRSDGNADLRNVFSGTISEQEPEFACAFVDNHDTQPSQALESWVEDWFKPHAYALILLQKCLYPCVFYGDYYGIPHSNKQPVPFLREMVWIRKNLLSDQFVNYPSDDQQKLCWTVLGDHPIVVILSEGDWKEQTVQDLSLAGLEFVDIHDENHRIRMDEKGVGSFTCPQRNISIYLQQEDYERLKDAMNGIGDHTTGANL